MAVVSCKDNMEDTNPFDYYDARAEAPKPKPKPKKKIPKKKSVMVQRKAKTPPPPPKELTVNLTIKHTINGAIYGPGAVTVPFDIAMILAENEQRNRAEERGLKAERAHLIYGGARTVEVPADFFDDPGALVSGVPVAFSQSGKGYTNPKGAQQI